MRTTVRLLVLIVVLSLFVAVAPVFAEEVTPQPVEPTTEIAGDRSHTKCWIYNITIKGYAGGVWFQRSGRLGVFYPGLNVATPNGKNSYDMWVVSGEPGYGSPFRGELLFTTNTWFGALTPYAGNLADMAYVKWLSTYVLEARPHTPQNFSFPTNKMRISNSVSGSFRWADQGYVRANFGNHPKVNGSIYLKELNVSGVYSATFTGNLYSYSTSSSCRFNNRSAEDTAVR
jgi:hypothetical protein